MVIAAIVEARRKLKYDLRGRQQKVVVNFMKSRFTAYKKRGGCYSGQALVCAIPVAHIAFVVHEFVAQHSDKQRTIALTACSQHGARWVGVACALNCVLCA